ncbi:hypothetical protein GOODEAATRI_022273 [Goodea atripinnis]|uniref:FAD/NAD(P)-binding domain-containing protein n=1 Tax=Goodea atripinnis TaxID=208336 RepID=A0ABV0NWR7_9TELE
MEVASYMIDKASTITVVGSSEMPYQNTLGREVGKITMMMLLEKGVRFYMNDQVMEIKGVNGQVKEVVLKSGNVITADVLIVGIGSIPNSEYLQGTKIKMNSKNFVVVDKFMQTNVPDVFCAGDLASFPLAVAKNQLVNIGHWQMAQAQGRIAALNMLKKTTELTSVPYYWTVLLSRTIRYAGRQTDQHSGLSSCPSLYVCNWTRIREAFIDACCPRAAHKTNQSLTLPM